MPRSVPKSQAPPEAARMLPSRENLARLKTEAPTSDPVRREVEANRVAKAVLERSGGRTQLPRTLPPPPSVTRREGPPPAALQRELGTALGYDFSSVRIHADENAAWRTRAQGAVALTAGRHVYFAPGRYRPDLPIGLGVVAHEMTHAAQQGAVPRRRRAPSSAQAHLREIKAGGAPEPQRYRSALRSFLDGHAIEERRRAGRELLDDSVEELTPAPPGMQQRSILTGCTCDGEREPAPTPTPAEPETAPGATPRGSAPLRVAGSDPPTRPFMVIRVAWTIDDGPTAITQAMDRTLGGIPGTWFIMRNQLGTGDELADRLQSLKALQDEGQEVAIHSMSSDDPGHFAWFPVDVSSNVTKKYELTADAMADLRSFTGLLRDRGLRVNFVRLPGGLFSELVAYLTAHGVSDANGVARQVINGEDVSSVSGAAIVKRDYDLLQRTLSSLDLHLWAGTASGPEVTGRLPQSWEAESSIVQSRDSVNRTFRGLVDQYHPSQPAGAGRNRPRSLIVLTHDTGNAYVEEVRQDVSDMETYAASKGVKIEYYSLSALYTVLRGTQP